MPVNNPCKQNAFMYCKFPCFVGKWDDFINGFINDIYYMIIDKFSSFSGFARIHQFYYRLDAYTAFTVVIR